MSPQQFVGCHLNSTAFCQQIACIGGLRTCLTPMLKSACLSTETLAAQALYNLRGTGSTARSLSDTHNSNMHFFQGTK